MTDDTRQARIAAAEQAIDDAIWRLMGTRMSITGENLYQQVATVAIDAADAIGREWERVSVAEANRQLDAYGRACVALDRARHGSTADEEVWADERAEIRRYFIALLTAAPAERGDETGEKP